MQKLNAVLGAAQERLGEFGITLEVESVGAPLSVPIVTLSRAGAKAQYAVAAQESMTLSSVARGALPTPPHPLLIIGDRISRRSATAFRAAGIQFVDTLGNAFITFDGVFVEVHGRTIAHASETTTRVTRPQHPANIFSPRRSQVILALLSWPEISTAKIRDVAKAAGVSVGQTYDALARLEQAGFLVPGSRRLDRVDELLDYWTAAYPSGLSRRLEIAEYHGDPARPIKTPHAEQPIFLSGESAEGTDIARPATLTVYLDGLDPKLPIMNRWSSSPDRAPNIFVRRRFWVSPRPEASGQNAPWPIVYADLVAAGDARLGEVARNWRRSRARSAEV